MLFPSVRLSLTKIDPGKRQSYDMKKRKKQIHREHNSQQQQSKQNSSIV